MKLRIFSDPHIGVNRQENTTVSSRKEIAARTWSTAQKVIGFEEVGVCLGDVFDKYRVEPGAMLPAFNLLEHCCLCLAGNHDTINDKDSMGSLQFLRHVAADCAIIQADYGAQFMSLRLIDNTAVYAIPHVTTQMLFEQSLEEAYEEAKSDTTPHKLLLLHCNYNYPADRLTSAELNLSKEDAEALIEDCGFTILIGHMHTPASYFEGKLQIIGSVTNTGFADLSDKRTLLYDTETGELTSHTHWRKREHFLSLDVNTLTLDSFDMVSDQTEFITLTGEVGPDEIFFLSSVQKKCWEEFPNLLALRDKTQLVTGDLSIPEAAELTQTQTFSQFLQARMPDDNMKTLFEEVKSNVA
jgi:DNA repair exonuclease SbcCD nuclease subunit